MPVVFSRELPNITRSADVRVWFCRRGQRCFVHLLDDPCWCEVHWNVHRSRVCQGIDCPSEWHTLVTVCRGYAPALRLEINLQSGNPEWVRSVIEITPEIGHALRSKHPSGMFPLLWKPARGRADLKIDFQPLDVKHPKPPEVDPWDIRPILLHLWNANPGAKLETVHEEQPRLLRLVSSAS